MFTSSPDPAHFRRAANVGAKAIRARMRRGDVVGEIPSIASIKRVLKDAGVTRAYRTKRRSTRAILGLPTVTRGGVWQQSDWVQDWWLEGGIKYQSLQISGLFGILCRRRLDQGLALPALERKRYGRDPAGVVGRVVG
jgi:hypothetical protein